MRATPFIPGLLALLLLSGPIFAGTTSLNSAWRFRQVARGEPTAGYSKPGYDDSGWTRADLPHTANVEPLVMNKMWTGECWYRRDLDLPATLKGKKIFVHFDGAMNQADVWLNGKKIGETHDGGYLPFEADLTGAANLGGNNVLAVKLLNVSNPEIPPGKPLDQLDFAWYGGLYRDAQLVIQDSLHISDPVAANRPGSGGVFVTYPEASPNSARVHVDVDLQNESGVPRSALLRMRLEGDKNEAVVEGGTSVTTIPPNSNAVLGADLTVSRPRLWSPLNPAQYLLHIDVLDSAHGSMIDHQDVKIGIRRFVFSRDHGFEINGDQLFLRGTDRHQEYPYLGYALSDAAHYRDAVKIKEAGFDFVRCCHYPASPAFLDACDELGIAVMEPIPGWQFMGDARFKERSYQAARDMIRRDRNHPCIVLWEVSLNETWMPADFMTKMKEITHEEYPGDQAYAAGWQPGYDVFIPARQHNAAPKYKGPGAVLISEYGDWEYFAPTFQTKQPGFLAMKGEERSSRQARDAGEKRLLQQALNFEEAANANREVHPAGDAVWDMFDYKHGCGSDTVTCGVMDLFRLPKFGTYFYRSQRDAAEKYVNIDIAPMVFIASFWMPDSNPLVRVYSNCEEVELSLNGHLIARKKPDRDDFSNHLAHPPFTFDTGGFAPGELKATGLMGGRDVADTVVRTPGPPVGIKLQVDRSGRQLVGDGADAVFIDAEVEDANGTVIPTAQNAIKLTVTGPARLIGENPTRARAGIACILLRSEPQTGSITVEAESDGLASSRLDLASQP